MAGPLLPQRKNNRSFQRPPMSDINVVPFIDVMLVLLVVFMITAPMMTQGVNVALPEVQNAPITDQDEPIQLTIQRNGKVFIQEREVDGKDLLLRLEAIKQAKPNTSVLLRADKSVDYGRVMEVMSALQTTGLVNVGMVTEPVSGR